MSAFAEARIDDDLIIYHTIGGPSFQTVIGATQSGYESRDAVLEFPGGKWELGERRMLPADFERMQDFFHARRGRWEGFRFKNWGNYRDMGHGILLPIAGSTTTMQMFKTYPSGGSTSMSKITKPIAGIKIFRNAVIDVAAVVDTTTGIVTPASTTGTLTWTGEFDWPVRFDADEIRFEFIASDGAGGAANVTDVYFHLFSLPIVVDRH